ncbi:MAG: D-alanyl-D-alanine carboxypeptidase [Lewinella sp.]|nr:D-alanyl-D-alanine carboxypeptidase [Lewinella sp.]
MTRKSDLQLPVRFLILISIFFLAGTQVQSQLDLSGSTNRKLQELTEFNKVFEGGQTGFVLYDLDYQTNLYGINADRRFVPASNVKLLTFYLANRILSQQAPGLFYQEFNDHYEVWGTGYPLLLHPSFTGFDEVGPWLAAREKPVVVNFPIGPGQSVSRYGPGWSWDDYNGSYVYERSALPFFGNRLYLDLSPVDIEGRQVLVGAPVSIAGELRELPGQKARIRRSEFGNDFTVSSDFIATSRFPMERPLHLSDELVTNELSATFSGQRISAGQAPYPAPVAMTTLEVSLPDTVFRKLLQNSDNFLAEQLLLQSAAHRYHRPDAGAIIEYAKDTLLPALGIEDIRWVDGSGLSRYNLLTPRQMVRIVMALDQEVGRDRLLTLLPEGGSSGTLKSRFDNKPKPYVWAKTGSLSGVLCVSGLMQTKRGKWLAFSFMHNNFTGRSASYYQEMETTLGWCYENL